LLLIAAIFEFEVVAISLFFALCLLFEVGAAVERSLAFAMLRLGTPILDGSAVCVVRRLIKIGYFSIGLDELIVTK